MNHLESVPDLQNLLKQYLDQYPSEHANQVVDSLEVTAGLSLSHFLATTKSEDLYNRKNFNGHLTASAFILSPDAKRVLLLHHKSLDRWLQPGGHIDDTDGSILDAAYREVLEETGLSKENLTLHSIGGSNAVPFDIDSHAIPTNPRKEEAAHVHHDIRYLMQVNASASVKVSAEESNGFQWVGLEELRKMDDHLRVADKIKLLNA